MGARQSGTGAERTSSERATSLRVFPSLCTRAAAPDSLYLFRSSCPNLLIYSIRTGRDAAAQRSCSSSEARRRLPAAEGKPKALSLLPGLREVQTCVMRLEIKRKSESGRDDDELKNCWVFLTPARRCKIHSLRQPTEYSSNRVGEGFGRCVSRQIRKWNPLVTRIR